MTNALRKIRISLLILTLFEVSLFAAAVIFYVLDIPAGFRELAKPPYWAIGAGVIMLINISLACYTIIRVSRIRQKSDIDAADVIGGDIKEAYNFGQLGLAITNSQDVVIWDSTIFKERSIDLLDKNIIEWQPRLNELKEGGNDTTIDIIVDSKTYKVKYLREAHLYIFKDVTDFSNLSAYEREHSMVIGQIIIDNYSEIVGNGEDENNDIVSRVRSAIFDYAKEYNAVVRRYRSDSYFVICTYGALAEMERNKFELLSIVRSLGNRIDTTPTLSIGFAHDFQDTEKLHEMAAQAINIAMSRGGDQAVVSEYNKELKFYGGKTQAIESTSKVKVRNFADGFLGLMGEAKLILVMGHANADMDSLGACLGVMAMADHCQVPCRIIYDPKNTETKTRRALQSAFPGHELDKMTISPKEAYDKIDENTLLVVVDVSVPENTHAPDVLDKSTKTVVIDHHRMGKSFIERNILSYIEPSASSASEILAELINYSSANPRIEMKPSFATLMLSGMFLDTNFFKSKSTGGRTFDAAEVLKSYGADNVIADDYLKDEYEEYSLITKIVSTMKTPVYGVVYCVADEEDIIESATISKVANQLMQLKGINAAFVIGRIQEKEVKISCRSDSTINVQLLAEKMNPNSGGGHFSMAAALFKNQSVSGVESLFLDTIRFYLSEARSNSPREE